MAVCPSGLQIAEPAEYISGTGSVQHANGIPPWHKLALYSAMVGLTSQSVHVQSERWRCGTGAERHAQASRTRGVDIRVVVLAGVRVARLVRNSSHCIRRDELVELHTLRSIRR